MLVKSMVLGVSILSLSGFASSGSRMARDLGPSQSASGSASDLTASVIGKSPSESLTVLFYAKVYALSSADSPMLGVTEDGSRLPVYQRRGEWVQIGFRHATGWIHQNLAPITSVPGVVRNAVVPSAAGVTAPAGASATLVAPGGAILPETQKSGSEEPPVSPRFSKSILITAACGALMLGVLILAMGVQSNRKRNQKQATVMVEQLANNIETKTCALEGRILPNGLSEILQFLETGRRTGMLSIEEELPSGIINFHFGQITFAQTRRGNGKEAVMEILSMTSGAFRFFEDKRVVAVNCRLSPLDVLMQHAQRVDEYQHRGLRTAS